jgi:hypothetical protein
MRRPRTIDDLSPMDAAAAVIDFIERGKSGPWQISTFEVNETHGAHDWLRSFGDGGGRYTPPGTYLMLNHVDPDSEVSTMMSSTPDELSDHEPFIEAAEGRVLVTGLGLSCVVSGLLAKDEVEHIDVVEYDADVIALVGPSYLLEPRVTIHHADAAQWDVPPNAHWDYAWHDIWGFISDKNLDDDDAENGISYRRLFQKYADHADYQAAWAFDLALAMRWAGAEADRVMAVRDRAWAKGTEDERLEILMDYLRQPNPVIAALHAVESDGDADAAIEASRPSKEALYHLHGGEEGLREKCRSDNLRLWEDSGRYLGQGKLLRPGLIEEELEGYGLGVADDFATKLWTGVRA